MNLEENYLCGINRDLNNIEKKENEYKKDIENWQFDFEKEKIVLARAKNSQEFQNSELGKEVLSQIEANIYALGDLIRMSEGKLEELKIEKTILRMRKRVIEDWI